MPLEPSVAVTAERRIGSQSINLTPPLSVRLSVRGLALNLKTAKYTGVTISPGLFRPWAWRSQRKSSLTWLSTFKELWCFVRARNLSWQFLNIGNSDCLPPYGETCEGKEFLDNVGNAPKVLPRLPNGPIFAAILRRCIEAGFIQR